MFNTSISDFSTGYFNAENLIKNSNGFLALRKEPMEETAKHFKRKLINQIHLLKKEIKEAAKYIENNIYLTNLFELGYDVERLALRISLLDLLKRMAVTFGYVYIDHSKYFDEYIELSGFEKVEYYSKKNIGMVFALYHWGAFQLAPALLLKLLDKKFIGIAAETPLFFVKKHTEIYQERISKNLDFHPININTINKTVKRIKKGDSAIMLPELSGIGSYSKVLNSTNFLGLPIRAPLGMGAISYYSKSPLFALTIDCKDDLHLKVQFTEIPFKDLESLNKEAVTAITDRLWSYLEKIVLQTPEQWFGWEIMDRIQRGY